MINIPPFEILPYKTLNDTNYNINYNLRNLETDLALTSKAKDYISSNVVLSIVVHCSGIIFYEAKSAQWLSKFKCKLAFSWIALIH